MVNLKADRKGEEMIKEANKFDLGELPHGEVDQFIDMVDFFNGKYDTKMKDEMNKVWNNKLNELRKVA